MVGLSRFEVRVVSGAVHDLTICVARLLDQVQCMTVLSQVCKCMDFRKTGAKT